jgi:hypothetical protein
MTTFHFRRVLRPSVKTTGGYSDDVTTPGRKIPFLAIQVNTGYAFEATKILADFAYLMAFEMADSVCLMPVA